MDITVERNAFGRQVDSFVEDLEVDLLSNGREQLFPAVFIRAPRLTSVNGDQGAEVIARLEDGTAVAALQNHWLVTSFHPELTGDNRFHRFFLKLVSENTE
jgi:5'-phosphate synthase pdxT subunit